MTKKRIATMATCIALVGAVAVGGTLALLSSQSYTLTNTFTVGNAYPDNALTLDEAIVDQVTSGTDNFGGYEAKDDGTRTDTTANATQAYKDLVAETYLDKDPTFHLAAESPDSWIIAHVTGVDALKDDGISIVDGDADEDNNVPEGYGWLKLDIETGMATEVVSYDNLTDGYYVTKNIIAASGSTNELFEKLYVGDNVDRDNTLASIVVKGVAVESVSGNWANDKAAVIAQAKTVDGFYTTPEA